MKKAILGAIITAIFSILIFFGCTDPSGNPTGGSPTNTPTTTPITTTTPVPTIEPALINIYGNVLKISSYDPPIINVSVIIMQDGEFIQDAAVLINDIPCSYDSLADQYWDQSGLLDSIADDADVVFNITGTGFAVNETLKMPKTAHINTPAGGTYNAENALNVSWNSLSPAPGMISIDIYPPCTLNPFGYSISMPGNYTNYSIPGNTLEKDFSDITLDLTTINQLPLTGAAYDADSGLEVINVVMSASFRTNP